MRPAGKPTIWIVEDDAVICCLFADVVLEYGDFLVSCVDNATQVKAREGDMIFLDMHGTKAGQLRSNNARVVTMSGDWSVRPELPKPFRYEDVQQFIQKFIAERHAAKAA
jgi:DNA-binding NtrC family response regulator